MLEILGKALERAFEGEKVGRKFDDTEGEKIKHLV